MPGGATASQNFAWPLQWPPKIFRVTSCHCIEVLHRPLAAPLVAKLAPPVPPQVKMSGSAPGHSPFRKFRQRKKMLVGVICIHWRRFPLCLCSSQNNKIKLLILRKPRVDLKCTVCGLTLNILFCIPIKKPSNITVNNLANVNRRRFCFFCGALFQMWCSISWRKLTKGKRMLVCWLKMSDLFSIYGFVSDTSD